jgi:hypothetical protein
MLWVYTDNDHFFPPPLPEKFHRAFTEGGGKAKFIKAGPIGKDGHHLFTSLAGIPVWTPLVDAFLAEQGLRILPKPLAPPALAPPPQLSARGREAFERYRLSGYHKAFAMASNGRFGWKTHERRLTDAKARALEFCRARGHDCRIVFADDEAVR